MTLTGIVPVTDAPKSTPSRRRAASSIFVVKRSSANYRQPVLGGIRAVCVRPTPAEAEGFLTDVRRHRKARLELTALVEGTAGKPAVEFTGSFVAML